MHEAAKFVKEQELMRLLLAGYMVKEAAAQLQLSVWTVRKYARQPEFLLKLKQCSAEIYERVDAELSAQRTGLVERVDAAADRALTVMEHLMDNAKKEELKFKAAQDVLDRAPEVSRTRKIDSTAKQEHSFLNPMVLMHAAATAQEVAAYNEQKELSDGEHNA